MSLKDEIKPILETLVESGLDKAASDIIVENLDKPLTLADNSVMCAGELVINLYQKFEGDLASIIPTLVSIAGFCDSEFKFAALREQLDEGKITSLVVLPETKTLDDGKVVHTPGIIYTLGLTNHKGVELVMSSNAPEDYMSNVIAGVMDIMDSDESFLERLKDGRGAILSGFFTVDENTKYDARVVPVELESLIEKGCSAYASDIFKGVFEDTKFYQVLLPDPSGLFPTDEDYNKDFGQIVF